MIASIELLKSSKSVSLNVPNGSETDFIRAYVDCYHTIGVSIKTHKNASFLGHKTSSDTYHKVFQFYKQESNSYITYKVNALLEY